jgi:probable O-glycosylation ligase (exosortase A-associated)
VTAFWLLFTLWVSIAALFALNPEGATGEWFRFIKIQLMTLMMMIMLTDRRRIEITLWVIAGSIAFYGTKGGLFTLLSGGKHHVLGPPNTFIGGSNEIAVATIIVLPLLWYMWHTAERRWVRHALLASSAMCVLSILGSSSRGATLALIVMLGMLWLKSSGKFVTGTLGLFAHAAGMDGAHAKHYRVRSRPVGARTHQRMAVRLQSRQRSSDRGRRPADLHAGPVPAVRARAVAVP